MLRAASLVEFDFPSGSSRLPVSKMSPLGARPKTMKLGMAALILLAIVGFSFREWRQYAAGNADAVRSTGIRESAARLLTGLLDAETGQRGFLLTGADRYLEPYNRAIQSIPTELVTLRRLLLPRPADSTDLTRLNDLVDRKLAELQLSIDLRRKQGPKPAIDLILSDEGKRTMDEIRVICSELQRRESAAESEASLAREGAALTTLLVTIGGSLLLLFFFSVGLEPVLKSDSPVKERSWMLVYGSAVVATAVAVVLRMALTPFMGPFAVPYIIFFPAVAFCAWYGGIRAGALSLVLSALAAGYFFVAPTGVFSLPDSGDRIGLLVFLLTGFGITLLGHSQRRAVERVSQEVARRTEAERAEREQRRRFETTLASIGDAVISTDAKGQIVFANAVAKSLLRVPRQEITGMPLDEVFRIIHETSRQPVESPVAKALRDGSIVALANHTVLIAGDGTEIPIDDSAAPIRDENGLIQGTVLVFRDITSRRQTDKAFREGAEEIRTTNEALRRSNDDLERFAFVASHDLQEPLRMIAAYAQLLVNKYPQSDEETVMYVRNVVDGTIRMRELIADLLTYTELREQEEMSAEVIDLNLIVQTVRLNLKASIDEAGAVITTDPLPAIRAHAAHFVPLFQNLIGNAIKYRSEVAPLIHISVRKQGDLLHFSVADNGIGIAPEYYEQVFIAFKRLHGRRVRGTGIGLAICQRVVERYQGRIWVESEVGRGSTFHFTLPDSTQQVSDKQQKV